MTVESHLLLLCALNKLWCFGKEVGIVTNNKESAILYKILCSHISSSPSTPFLSTTWVAYICRSVPILSQWDRQKLKTTEKEYQDCQYGSLWRVFLLHRWTWARVSPTLGLASLPKWSGLLHRSSLYFSENRKTNSYQRQIEVSDISSLYCTEKGEKTFKSHHWHLEAGLTQLGLIMLLLDLNKLPEYQPQTR